MTAKVFHIPGPGDLTANTVLEMAKGRLTQCVVIGIDDDGDLAIYSTTGELAKVSWWLTLTQAYLVGQVGS
jgi:hypothetical protein